MTAGAWPGPDVLEEAVHGLCARGYLEPDDDGIDPGLLGELAGIARSCGLCRTRPWELADHWLSVKQQEWERALPVWRCDCGTGFKTVAEWGREAFYLVTDDGLLGNPAGWIRLSPEGRVKGGSDCPSCGLGFAGTIARRANPQLALF